MRFADLASPYLETAKSVLDLGCGPAEITCELAIRHPGISFLGIDHSEKGIDRAKQNARVLKLQNIEFRVDDVDNFQPNRNFDMVLMFDSFHHFLHPHRVIQKMQQFISRFLLIEPHGNWKGDQVRDFEFDWIVSDLEKIRHRIAMMIGEKETCSRNRSDKETSRNPEAIENRYNLGEFKKIFRGFGLSIRGTVSGLDSYPPDPYLKSPSRDFFGKMAYDIFVELDNMIFETQIDLLAKHWVIFASKDLKRHNIRIPKQVHSFIEQESIRGPYDIEFIKYDGPDHVQAGIEFRAQVQFRNRSFRQLSSFSLENPDFISYHWLSTSGEMVFRDGIRSSLVKKILPEEASKVELRILSPEIPGKYILAIDFVHEGKTWYSEAGNPSMPIPVDVTEK